MQRLLAAMLVGEVESQSELATSATQKSVSAVAERPHDAQSALQVKKKRNAKIQCE